jgi:hypothetical protein
MEAHAIGPFRWASLAKAAGRGHGPTHRPETPMRLIPAAMIALIATPALATPIGPPAPLVSKISAAQQAISLYRDEYRHGYVACPAPSRANEVVICGNGRGGSANRIPLPDERTPRDWARTPTGDRPGGADALAATTQTCAGVHCPVHGAMDVIAAGVGVVQVVRAVIDPEGASDYADRHPWKPKD